MTDTPDSTSTEEIKKDASEEQEPESQEETSPDIKSEENKTNWKKFREEREKDRKARLEAEAQAKKKAEEAEALKAAMDALLNKNQPQQQEDVYEGYETDEQRVSRLVKEQLENERRNYEQQRQVEEQKNLPQRLNSEFKDFNTVCNTENIDYLEYHHPEIAKAFTYMPENYDKWASLYKTVKKMVPFQNKGSDESRIEHNQKKPQAFTPSTPGTTNQDSSWKLTEQIRTENWRRMQEDAKRI